MTGRKLLAWYDRHCRDLPWRMAPGSGRAADPYRVWLSEIMLQQTRVETVRPYFLRFVERWPDVRALAAAPLEEILAAWAGLGYYSRARNLKRCAEAVAARPGGRFPGTASELAELPGIGPYTAAAIAAIAFGEPVAAIDGNVERVVCRLLALGAAKGEARPAIRAAVEAMLPPDRPGDFAQALMDLGATICTPRNPACHACPLAGDCQGRDDPHLYPGKAPRTEKPLRRGAAYLAYRHDGALLLQRRPASGLLGGMAGLPTSDWSAARDGDTGTASAPIAADWRRTGEVRHVFTHFTLQLQVYRADGLAAGPPEGCWWSRPEELGGLPTLFRKALRAGAGGGPF